ncbi:MAG: GIN domain-containing protein [Capsulimonadaceae bacterium]
MTLNARIVLAAFAVSATAFSISGCGFTRSVNCSISPNGGVVCNSSSNNLNVGGGPVVVGNGKVTTVTRRLAAFDGVHVAGGIRATSRAGQSAVTISADSNLIPLIKTTVQNGQLTVENNGSYRTNDPITITVTSPSLKSLEASGASDVTVGNVDPQTFSIDASGGSQVKCSKPSSRFTIQAEGASDISVGSGNSQTFSIDASGGSRVKASGSSSQLTIKAEAASDIDGPNVNGQSLDLSASGGSQVHTAGTASNVSIEAHGASDIAAQKVSGQTATVDASGGSQVKFDARQSATIDASGASQIDVWGNPRLTRETSGASSINTH